MMIGAGAPDPAGHASMRAGKWEKNKFMGTELTD
jgi:phosphoglycerate dehydrogenase-like enzyme